jgi:hypothetical protein
VRCIDREDLNPVINSVRPQICSRCGKASKFICDWRTGGGRCDALMCDRHAYQRAENDHLCPMHRERGRKK